jgi:NADPH:quinone reductase-like Zn-dependent oxidoreductase
MDPLNGEDSVRGYDLLKPLGRIIYFGMYLILFIKIINLFIFLYIGAANVAASGENRSYLTAFKTWYKCFTTNSLSILSNNKSIAGYHLGYLLKDLDNTKDPASNTINELFRLYNEGALKPQIDSIYPFSKIDEAMKRMHNRQNIGKVLLRPDNETNDTENNEVIEQEQEQEKTE